MFYIPFGMRIEYGLKIGEKFLLIFFIIQNCFEKMCQQTNHSHNEMELKWMNISKQKKNQKQTNKMKFSDRVSCRFVRFVCNL